MTYLEQLLGDAKVEWRPLGEVAELKRGVRVVRRQLEKEGQYPVYQNCLTPLGYFDKANCKAETAFVIMGGSAGKVGFSNVDFWAADDCLYFITPEHLLSRYLYYFLCKKETYLDSQVRRAAVPRLARSVLANLLIPLPPLAVQERIVEILDKFTALIEALETELELRTRQYEYYRNKLLRFGKEVEWKPLGEVCHYEQPAKYIVASTDYKDSFPTPVLTAGKTFTLGYTDEVDGIYPASEHPVIIFDDFTGALRWIDFDFKVKSSAMKMITSEDESVVLLRFIFYWLSHLPSQFVAHDHQRLWLRKYAPLLIPVPPLAVQEQIVAILDKFHTLVHSISEGLPAEIALRRRQYEYYRNLLLRFPFP